MKIETNICSLCFRFLKDSKWDIINSTVKTMLDLVSVDSKIEANFQSLICDSCVTLLESTYNFKVSCTMLNNIKTEKTDDFCKFCRKTASELMSRIKLMDNFRIQQILNDHLPELDIKPFEEILICEKCEKTFENFITFSDILSKSNVEMFPDHIIPNETEPTKLEKTDLLDFEDHNLEDSMDIKSSVIVIEDDARKYSRKRTKLLRICEICSFATRSLYSHKLIHKDPSQLQMFQCSECSFQTKRSQGLKKHMITHQPLDESRLINCPKCSYRTMHKSYLNRHFKWTHKITEETMTRCKICAFATKRPDHLRKHMRMKHTPPSELKWFFCKFCPYKAKNQHTVDKHIMLHEKNDNSLRKCELCNYKTRFANHLRRHMKFHENVENDMSENSDKTEETRDNQNEKLEKTKTNVA